MKLNLNSLNQKGGAIINFYDKLIKINSNKDDISYQSIDVDSNKFYPEEILSLQTFINFVLPFISYNGKTFGLDSIKNIETINGGSFGMTLAINDIIIKVSAIKKQNDIIEHITEIRNLVKIFDKKKSIPESLNKYFGFISSKKYRDLEEFNKYDGDLNIFSDLFFNSPFELKSDKMFSLATRFRKREYLETDFLDNFILIFLKKEDMNLSEFTQTIFPKLTDSEKIFHANNMLNDMKVALEFLHNNISVLHADIKPDNIVTTKNDSTGTYKFKLIDFGSAREIKPSGEIETKVLPPVTGHYYFDTIHENINKTIGLTYLYDYHCVIFSILELFGLERERILQLYKEVFELVKGDSKNDELINKFINAINKDGHKLPTLDKFEREKYTYAFSFFKDLISYMYVSSMLDGYIKLA
jgi:serine/threonine protein kinase